MTRDQIAFSLNEISLNLRSWLDSNQKERDGEGMSTDDDTCIMVPPHWPARGALKLWIETIEAARDRIGEPVEIPMFICGERLRTDPDAAP